MKTMSNNEKQLRLEVYGFETFELYQQIIKFKGLLIFTKTEVN